MKNCKIYQVLNKILLEKYYDVLKRKQRCFYFRTFWDRLTINFKEYLLKEGFVIIAEIKKASPLSDEFRKDFNPLKLASAYE